MKPTPLPEPVVQLQLPTQTRTSATSHSALKEDFRRIMEESRTSDQQINLRSRESSFSTRCFSIDPHRDLVKKLGSEFIGTFILIFGAAGSSIMNEKTNGQVTYVGLAAAAGLAVMAVILSTGHISGAHVNPAITIAFATFKHFPWIQVPLYIGAQVSGSVCSSFVLKLLFRADHKAGLTLPTGSAWQSLFAEFIMTLILMFVVTAVSTDTRAVGELAGIAVGVTVILNNLAAGGISGGSMNPVRSLGPAVAANNLKDLWVYIVGPIGGAIVGAGAYSFIRVYKEIPNGEVRISSFRQFP